MYHPNPKEFLDSCDQYKSIGGIVVALSNLEFAHDNFVLAVNRSNPKLASKISRKFPRQFRQKTDFVICVIAHSFTLRQTPIFGDGSLDLQWLQYKLDELYELRAAIAHGSILYSKTSDKGTLWRLDRIVSTEKNRWGEQSLEIGTSYLADVWLTTKVLKHYLVRLTRVIENGDSWEADYKIDCEIRANLARSAEWVELGIVESDPFLEAFKKGPIE